MPPAACPALLPMQQPGRNPRVCTVTEGVAPDSLESSQLAVNRFSETGC